MVPKVAHGTERVNMIKDFKVLLASKGLNYWYFPNVSILMAGQYNTQNIYTYTLPLT
jgi:hypothetical protein